VGVAASGVVEVVRGSNGGSNSSGAQPLRLCTSQASGKDEVVLVEVVAVAVRNNDVRPCQAASQVLLPVMAVSG
jgi:hypothetical protein